MCLLIIIFKKIRLPLTLNKILTGKLNLTNLIMKKKIKNEPKVLRYLS